jgi:hypothetical protein
VDNGVVRLTLAPERGRARRHACNLASRLQITKQIIHQYLPLSSGRIQPMAHFSVTYVLGQCVTYVLGSYPEEVEILQAAEESHDPKNLDGPIHSTKYRGYDFPFPPLPGHCALATFVSTRCSQLPHSKNKCLKIN